MNLNVKAFTVTVTVVWAGAVLLCGLANLVWNDYGSVFLQLAASIYPGYDGQPSLWSVIVGSLYAVVDGAFGGLVFVLIYNRLAGKVDDSNTAQPNTGA
jgi:hypothetical protein